MDHLVKVIFDAARKENASPEERRLALIRAGSIAQLYDGDKLLVEQIFKSLGDMDELKQNDNLNLSSGSTAINGGTH